MMTVLVNICTQTVSVTGDCESAIQKEPQVLFYARLVSGTIKFL